MRQERIKLLAGIASMLLVAGLFTGCDDDSSSRPNPVEPPIEPPVEPESTVSARVAEDADLLQGPLARGVAGDYVLENENFRVIIQQPGRQWLSIGTFGGNIIDVSARQADGSFLPDHMEEFVLGLNIENTPNYTEVEIVNDGSDGEQAVICARGPDDLLEFINPSSTVAALGLTLPSSADDRDLPLTIETCYSVVEGARHIEMVTTFSNLGSDELPIYLVEYLSGSGQVELFQPYAGFGEPFFTPSCPDQTYVACGDREDGLCDQCNFVAYSGVDGAAGVSYGLIHGEQRSSSLSTAGVSAVVYGEAAFNILLGLVGPNYTVPGDGMLEFTRYFAVGDGTVDSIAAVRNDLFGIDTVEISGKVSSAGEPLSGAQVVVYQVLNDQTSPPQLFLANHARSNEAGEYTLSLPPGEYEIRANMEGYLFPEDDPRALIVEAGNAQTQDFSLPEPGYLEVTLIDEVGPGPGKLQLVGFDPSPPLSNTVSGNEAGIFGDIGADHLPFGIAQAAFIDRDGASKRITMEPGEYQLVLSRGPRYSAYKENIVISPGQVTTVQAEIAKVVDDSGFIHGDFHVHSIDSPDAEVTREERVAVMLAEGMDFFTPSDHGYRADFAPTLEAMGVSDLISTASSSETTTFDYGHFNSWPTTVNPASISGGSFDWAGEAPAGMNFPEYGNYNLPPAQIIAGLKEDPMENLVQINHIDSHFGAGGLAIDTGQTPPQSEVDLLTRRLDPTIENAFDSGFDVLEVWIGADGRNAIMSRFLGPNAGDWFNLMNQDLVRIGVANSDTHDRRFTRVSARTLIASDTQDPGQLASEAETLAATVLAGKAIGTNAPFLLLSAAGAFDGANQQAGLRLSDSVSMASDANGDVMLTATVQTAAWAQIDRLDFYINNQPELTTPPNRAARYAVCADASISAGDPGWEQLEVVVNEAVEGASRTEITATLMLEGLTEDTWVVAMASGSDGVSEPLFPVLPASLDENSNTTLADLTDGNLGEGGVPAFAFTNPIFIDVDGDGWAAPGVANAPCAEQP